MTNEGSRRDQFNERRSKCSQHVRDVLDFLSTVAANAGDQVEPPFYDGLEGVGITFKKGAIRFCRFDPKFDKEHVFAQIPGASRSDLQAAGTLPDLPRQDEGWVKVENMRGAVRLVPLILRKSDARGIVRGNDRTALQVAAAPGRFDFHQARSMSLVVA